MVLLQKNGFTRGASIYNGYLFTQAYSCMISHGWRACRAISVQQADAKPQFHRSFWRLRRSSWERVGPAQAHIAFFFGNRDFARGGCVSWTSIHAALPLEEKIEKAFELVGVSTVRS